MGAEGIGGKNGAESLEGGNGVEAEGGFEDEDLDAYI